MTTGDCDCVEWELRVAFCVRGVGFGPACGVNIATVNVSVLE